MEQTATNRTAIVVHGDQPFHSLQGPVYTPGVSAQTTHSQVLFLGVVTLQPGQRTTAHTHADHESAFYLMSGSDVEIWSGALLEHRTCARAGDYLYIPPRVPHVAVNRHPTQPAVFVGARNDPTASEMVEMHPELDCRVP
jgi:uncharacterized RmlC-like cupin family protein